MQNFTPGQIQKAYESADSRVLDAMRSIPIDDIIEHLQARHALQIDKAGKVRTMVDYVLVGLMSAKNLSLEIGTLFPSFKDPIITELNAKIFRPTLEYVRTHEPEEIIEPKPSGDAFSTSNIEIVADSTQNQETFPETNLQEESKALARSGIVLDDEEYTANIPPTKPKAVLITEEIESDPKHNITLLEQIPDKPGSSKPNYHHDPYQESL